MLNPPRAAVGLANAFVLAPRRITAEDGGFLVGLPHRNFELADRPAVDEEALYP